jgi:hypothetical protein
MDIFLYIIILSLFSKISASNLFQEADLDSTSVESTSSSEPLSFSTSQKAPVWLTSRIFADPFLGEISKFLPLPQYQLFALSKTTRSHFKIELFSYCRFVSDTFCIPGLRRCDDLVWFDGTLGFKNDNGIFISLLLDALVRQKQFPYNHMSISNFIISALSSHNFDRSQGLFAKIPELLDFLISENDYGNIVKLVTLSMDRIENILDIFYFKCNMLKFFKALKAHSMDFESVYRHLLHKAVVKSETLFLYFIVRSIESDVPLHLFIDEIFDHISQLSVIFGILNSSVSIDASTVVNRTELKILERARKLDNQELSGKTLDFLTLLNEIRFHSHSEEEIHTQLFENDWSPEQIITLSEAAILAGKLDLFAEIVKRYREEIVLTIYEDLKNVVLMGKCFFHLLALLNETEISKLKRLPYFQLSITDYYDLIKVSETVIRGCVYISLTYKVLTEYADADIPEVIPFTFSIQIFKCSQLLKTNFLAKLFKNARSLNLLAPQLMNCDNLVRYLEKTLIRSKSFNLIREIDDLELKELLFDTFKFYENEATNVFESSAIDLAVINHHQYDKISILHVLSKFEHFEKFEIFIESDLATFLIPRINSQDHEDYEFYFKIRHAIRYIKHRYPERIDEITNTFILGLIALEHHHLW